MVLLEDQDRSLWDRAQIEEGLALVETLRGRRRPLLDPGRGSRPSTLAPSAPRTPTGARIGLLYGQLAGSSRRR